MEISPTLGEALFGKANALQGLGEVEESLPLFELAIQHIPKEEIIHQKCLFKKGESLRTLGKLGKAVTDWEEVVRLELESGREGEESKRLLGEAFAHIGGVQYLQGDKAAALETFDRALAYVPKDAYTWRRKGETLRRLDRFSGRS